MKQILSFVRANTSPGAASVYTKVGGGDGPISTSLEIGIVVVPAAGTYRNLVTIFSDPEDHPDQTISFNLNGVDTALAVDVTAGDDYFENTTDEVEVVAGDLIAFRILRGGASVGDYKIGFSIELEAEENTYVIGSIAGTFDPDEATFGGILGNGYQESYAGGGSPSGSFSICAVPGTLTGTTMYDSHPPGSGSWITRILLNGVLQDGAGATVDTTVTLTDDFVQGSYELPLVVTDVVDIITTRLGTQAPFQSTHVVSSVTFTPTNDGMFMLCGGSSVTVEGAIDSYHWNAMWIPPPDEDFAMSPVGPLGFEAYGLYINRRTPAAEGNVCDHYLRKSGVSTDFLISLTGPDQDGFVVGNIPYVDGDTIDILVDPQAAFPGQMHWGLAAAIPTVPPDPPPEPPTEITEIIRRLRRAPHLSSEQFRQFFKRLQIDIQPGVGLSTGQGSDPQMMLRWSDDGGFTWSSEYWTTAGAIGAYSTRAIWNRLGSGRDRIFEVTVTDPVNWVLLNAYLEAEKGTS